MSEIKTAEQRIHKLEGGEGDSFVTFEQALIAERDELRAALADRDARLAALEGAYIPTYLERLAASPATLEAEFTALRSEALDLRAALAERDAKLAALEDWRSAVAMAYGHLWHINNEPMAPIPLRSEESASYAARKLLRDLLTTEERGEAINSVRAMLTASPKEPT